MSFLGVDSLVLPLICLSSSSLCLLFFNHSQMLKPSVLFMDMKTHLGGFQVVYVRSRHLCFHQLLKCKCAYKTLETLKAYLKHLLCGGIFLDQRRNVCLPVFYVRRIAVRHQSSVIFCSCGFLLPLFFFNGHSCCASSC